MPFMSLFFAIRINYLSQCHHIVIAEFCYLLIYFSLKVIAY